MHPRQLIRNAVVETLRNRTSAGPRVQATRVEPYKKLELPAISVYTLGEQVDPSVRTSLREITRDLSVEIAGWVAHSPGLPVDDAMDALAAEIEAVMDDDPYLGGAAADSMLESTELSIRDEGDPLLGLVTLTYAVTYRTTPEPASTDDFLRAGITTRIASATDSNAAHDQLVVQESP